MSHNITTVAVVGAGQMGGGIAQVAATSGFRTIVTDSFPGAIDKCRALHDKLLARAVEKQKLTQADADAARSRITYAPSLDAAAQADIAIEAIVEDAAAKRDIFKKLAAMLPAGSILASNTSSISITELAAAVGERAPSFIGMHFFNPVPVMKLVEVIKGLATSPETTARTIALAEAMGKTAVPANDRPGFVSNRVLMPLINEAFYAWMEGVADPEHIDEIMKLGCNHPMGPLRLADFIGLDTCVHIMNVLADGLNNDRYRACPLLKQLVVAGRLGDKAGRGVYEHSR
ncbi:MAG: 3-hydroxyacyl-CoA dehydrogenase NAD-binding domain-containing protein [Phycisphaerales bacterium]|jgi:3-hydroxybutyryl-CoA dehydrogenase|nr:3-hydroxyacyl-CoA dehydrogenase NAD-binding domain-containing protein [Phycisphaerales bacterium]